MIFTSSKDEKLTFSVIPPICHPYRNVSRINAYYTYAPFDDDPFEVWAYSTSGSPVIVTANGFFGFTDDTRGGRFAYDGCGRLTVTVPAGQTLYYEEKCDPFAAWSNYSAAVRAQQEPHPNQPFWSDLEYCTWVDQGAEGQKRGISCYDVIGEDYVYRYMERIIALGLPKGKLTIDDGWDLRYPNDIKTIGNWKVERTIFPNLEKLAKDMTSEGFIPGLWFSPFIMTPNCDLAEKYPDLIACNWDPRIKEINPDSTVFIRPLPELMDVLEEYYRSVFSEYINMGFRKFKLDMSYGAKREMKTLLALIYRIIKELEPTVEVETHIPDIFSSRYTDTVRLNDVDLDSNGRWREVSFEHYKICKYSAYDRILNYDHIGANTTDPVPEAVIAHAKQLLSFDGGYPCVSYLPDRFDNKAQTEEFVRLINEWHDQHSRK